MAVTPIDVQRLIDVRIKMHIEEIDRQLLNCDNVAQQMSINRESLHINATVKNFVNDGLSQLIVNAYIRSGWDEVYYNTTREIGSEDTPEAYVNTTFRFKLY